MAIQIFGTAKNLKSFLNVLLFLCSQLLETAKILQQLATALMNGKIGLQFELNFPVFLILLVLFR